MQRVVSKFIQLQWDGCPGWDRDQKDGKDTIFDVRVTHLGSKTYVNRSSNKVLAAHEQEKKKQYLQACLDQQRFFVPLIVSTNGMLGEETKATVKQLAWLLSQKWDRPYSQICGLICSQLSVTIVWASHLCLRGSRVPYCKISRCIQWEGKAGVELHQASLL